MAEANTSNDVNTATDAPKRATRKATARRATAKPRATKAATAKPARKATRKASKAAPALNREKVAETMKEVVYAQLGVYGRIYDELNDRVSKARKDAPKQWDSLVKRGERVQKDLDKARRQVPVELRKDVEKRVAELKKIDVRNELQTRIEKVRNSVRKVAKRKAA